MDLAALRERLAAFGLGQIDLEAAQGRHLAAGGRDEADALLHSLLMEGALDRTRFAALSSDATVIVTGPAPARSSETPTAVIGSYEPTITLVSGEATEVQRVAESDAPAAPASGVAAPAHAAGRVDRRYVVLGTAGKGGMGIVHVARDVDLLRKVALKELAAEAAGEPAALARFHREVQVTAQLDHPNIVPVYSLEKAPGGQPAYAMKLVEGRTFAALIDETRAFHDRGVTPDEAHSLPVRLEHFLKVCDAMTYAHDRGVIHRDLKPANLMLGAHHEVYVMDWGICRVLGEKAAPDEPAVPSPISSPESTETQVGTIVGTPMYMSPEQAHGRGDLDPRSDQCALGLILYKMVTLQNPYDGRTGFEIVTQVVRGQRRPVQAEHGREPIPPEMVAIIERATSPERDLRYPNVRAFADDVRRFLRGEAVEARPDSSWQRLLRRLARHRQAVAMGVLAFVALASLAIVGLLWRHERALERQRFREARLQALTGDAGRAGDVLQTRVLEVTGELDALSAVAAQALLAGGDESGPVPGLDAGGAPNDATGLFTPAPGSDPATVRRLARRLLRAAPQERQLLERALRLLGGGRALASSRLAEIQIGLEAGLTYSFPSPSEQVPPSHPRERPWYRSGATEAGPHWGESYLDRGTVRLPFGAPIRGPDGALLGVISLVLAPQGIMDQVLAEDVIPGARTTLLLDRAARVLAIHPPAGGQRLMEPFAEPALAAALGRDDVGTLRTTAFGPAEMVAFDRIHPFEWTLAAIVPEEVLFAPRAR